VALVGRGSSQSPLPAEEVEQFLAAGLEVIPSGTRVLVIVPDLTRTSPVPLLFRLVNQLLGPRTAALDYLVALGTHPPLGPQALERLVGMSAAERKRSWPRVRLFNHRWDDPAALRTIGVIGAAEVRRLTDGLLDDDVPIRLNRLIDEYDRLLICGPVFPHEVAGFSGGAKYLFPGIAGPEIIDFTHWLGALCTSMATIGVCDTPVRRVVHRAAEFVPVPILNAAMVLDGGRLHGLWVGDHLSTFAAAAELSAELNVVWLERPYERVLSMPAARYDDLWTAAKAMYKTEPVVADGGEVVIYAPHLTEISYTHGALIDQVGYHVRDYFLAQWDRFRHLPGTVLAHSTHVKGTGIYQDGREEPRIKVTLSTAIPEERCRRVNLGYLAPDRADLESWRAENGLVVPEAGEKLYRLRNGARPTPDRDAPKPEFGP
jgi:nickel-dependent lactate racemase